MSLFIDSSILVLYNSSCNRFYFVLSLQLFEVTGIKAVCMDVANGYSEKFVDTVGQLRDKYSDVTIMAGNVVTGNEHKHLR